MIAPNFLSVLEQYTLVSGPENKQSAHEATFAIHVAMETTTSRSEKVYPRLYSQQTLNGNLKFFAIKNTPFQTEIYPCTLAVTRIPQRDSSSSRVVCLRHCARLVIVGSRRTWSISQTKAKSGVTLWQKFNDKARFVRWRKQMAASLRRKWRISYSWASFNRER